jgi:uncharacterized protein with FMN-binding domain
MSPTPWRGTLVFAGTLAAVAAVATVRFAGAEAAAAADDEPVAAAPTAAPTSSGTPAPPTAAPTSSGRPAPSPTAAPELLQPQADGSVLVVGDEVTTRYGTMQVAVTFVGRDIVAVDALKAPSWDSSSTTLNATVLPYLAERAVERDSADIGAVSGATYTSQAYRTSLQSAIDRLG